MSRSRRWWSGVDRRDVGRMLDSVVEEDAPLVGGIYGTSHEHMRYEFELVLLPLRHGGRAGMRMLGGFFPRRAPCSVTDWSSRRWGS